MNPKVSVFVYYVLFAAIITFSVYFYLPYFYSLLNSDMVIHVLMTKDFQLPRDYYYWGQNRLGSLLPMISYAGYFIFKIHPLIVCSIVQYLFLLIPFLLIAKHIKSIWLRLAFLCVIFLPFNSYNALLYIGHPYSQQFFCGTIFILLFLKVNQLIVSCESKGLSKTELVKASVYLMFSLIFFVLGIWVSEFNAILILIPVWFITRNFKAYFKNTGVKQHAVLAAVGLITMIAGYKWYDYTKDVSIVDAQYNKTFIFDKRSLSKEFDFMIKKVKDAFTYDNPDLIYENTIYLFFSIVLIYLFIKRKEIATKTNTLSGALILTSVISSVVLFFSFWNFKSDFCPRYYIPVYIMVTLALIFYLEKTKNTLFKTVFFIVVLFHCVMYSYNSLIRHHLPSPVEQYADFKTLPKGTLIGDYWETYLIQSIAIDNLQSINFDNQIVRIYEWKDIPLSEETFYFLNNENAKKHGLKDTLIQFNISFVFTGKRYNLKTAEVLEYKKLK